MSQCIEKSKEDKNHHFEILRHHTVFTWPLFQYQNEKGQKSQPKALMDEEFLRTEYLVLVVYRLLSNLVVKMEQLEKHPTLHVCST